MAKTKCAAQWIHKVNAYVTHVGKEWKHHSHGNSASTLRGLCHATFYHCSLPHTPWKVTTVLTFMVFIYLFFFIILHSRHLFLKMEFSFAWFYTCYKWTDIYFVWLLLITIMSVRFIHADEFNSCLIVLTWDSIPSWEGTTTFYPFCSWWIFELFPA